MFLHFTCQKIFYINRSHLTGVNLSISFIISLGSSERGLSEVMITLSLNSQAIPAIFGRFVASRSGGAKIGEKNLFGLPRRSENE